jgi:TonB-dependent Receptor Plug Domain.
VAIPSGKNDASAGFGVLALYVDGTRVQPREDIPSLLGSLRPSDIEAVEVYRGPSEVPIEALGDACAAIYIWTRLGG